MVSSQLAIWTSQISKCQAYGNIKKFLVALNYFLWMIMLMVGLHLMGEELKPDNICSYTHIAHGK